MNSLQHKLLASLFRLRHSTARQLGELLGIDESTVSRNLRPLIEGNLVVINGYLPATEFGGRKTRLLTLNPHWLRIVGLSLEQGQICLVRANCYGELLSCFQKNIEISSRNFNAVVSELLSNEDFDLLAIALPGLVKSFEKKVVFSEALELNEHSLEQLSRKPFLVFNDANAAAAAFLNCANNLVYFLLSIPYQLSKPVGLGAGIVINGSIYEGSNNSAGELGEGVSLINEDSFTMVDLVESREAVLRQSKSLSNFVEHISSKMATTLNLIDPELFVLGGDFHLLGREILEQIIQKVEGQITAKSMKRFKWEIDENGQKTVAIGSVAAVLRILFNDYEFARIVFKEGSAENAQS